MVIFMYILNNFLFFSIAGHIIEKIVNPNRHSGILYFYWTPVYGLGILTFYFIYYLVDKIKTNKFIKSIIIFFVSAIIVSLLEYLGGALIESLFNQVFWDYSNKKFNFGKYACLEMAFYWGISAVVMYFLKPLFDKIIKKIPRFVTVILSIGFVIDVISTIISKVAI